MKQQKILPTGFTLIEVAIVVLVGGLIMAAGATMLNDYLQESRIITTQNRMQDIDNAIIQYLNVNGVLPCAASLTTAQDSAGFGRGITDALPPGTDCYATAGAGGTFKEPSGRVPVPAGTNTTGFIVIGAVPVRTLNLPDQEIADAWGDRFVYAVTDALTVTDEYDPTQGSISVVDSSGASIATPPGSAQYVIVSLGADRAGAYSIAGIKGGVVCPAALEQLNCTYPTATFRKTMLIGNQSGANMYDDYVTFHTQTNSTGTVPSGLIAPFALTGCPPGWGAPVAGATCDPPPAPGICCQKQ